MVGDTTEVPANGWLPEMLSGHAPQARCKPDVLYLHNKTAPTFGFNLGFGGRGLYGVWRG